MLSSTSLRSTGTITGVSYCLITDDVKRKISVLEISNSAVFIGDAPVQGGLYDSRLGTTRDYACGTCLYSRKDVKLCPGHFGHIELKYPLKEPLLIQDIIEWLNMLCFKCASLIYSPSKLISVPQKDRFKVLKAQQDKADSCYSCKEKRHNKVVADKIDKLTLMFDGKVLPNTQIKALFNRVSPDLIPFLGLHPTCHPKNFLTNVVLVSPPNTRLELQTVFNKISSTDDITKLYKFIFEFNKKAEDTQDEEDLDKLIENMESFYFHLILGDPDSAQGKKIENPSKKPYKSFLTVVKGKQGLIRRYTQGKKLEKVARSVIVGETDVRPGHLIISTEAAQELLQRRRVTPYNINEMYMYLENDTYPCAKYVERDGERYRADIFKLRSKLRIGDYVYRHLANEDFVLFNRMPSLSWSSVATHKIWVIDDERAYRFNESECIHYNADFDGDEMNLYILNNTISLIEAKYLNHLNNWSISYANGACMIGLKEDAILGIGLLTRHGVEFEPIAAYRLFAQTTLNPKVKEFTRSPDYKGQVTKGKLSGRDIISIMLLEMGCPINYRNKSKVFQEKFKSAFNYNDSDEMIVISKGHLLSGILSKGDVQQKSLGTILHSIFNEYGNKKANEAAYNLQQVCIAYLVHRGFTVGIEDVILKEEALKSIQADVKTKMDESVEFHHKYLNNKLIAPINQTIDDYYETKQIATLSYGQTLDDKMLLGLGPNNAFYHMSSIGSKGNFKQMANSIMLRGQILLDGQRLKKECNGRAHPYSTKDSYNPMDRGFIKGYFAIGLDNRDRIGDSQEERKGLIGKSQETAVSGYFTRLLTKSTENEIVNNHFGITSSKYCMQLLFGGDGLDPRKQEINHIDIFRSDEDMLKEFKCELTHIDKVYHNKSVESILNNEFNEVMEARDTLRGIFINMETSDHSISFAGKIKLPISLERVVLNNYEAPLSSERFDPVEAYNDVRDTFTKITRVFTNEECKLDIPQYIMSSFLKLKSALFLFLSLRELIRKKISNKVLKDILLDIHISYVKAIIAPGTPSGAIQSQSLGEPATQSVLNSIHQGANIGGVEAIKNITQVRKYDIIKNEIDESSLVGPYMRFELLTNDEREAEKFANSIEVKKLRYFIKNITVMERNLKDSGDDQVLVDTFYKNSPRKSVSEFCVRLELDKVEMVVKNIPIDKIALKVYDWFDNNKVVNEYLDIHLIYSNMSDDKIILILYLVQIPSGVELNHLVADIKGNLKKCIISGINGIGKAVVNKHTRMVVKPDGTLVSEVVRYIMTDGINIPDVYNHPLVKKETVSCNSMLDMANYFGIAATESAVFTELKTQLPDNSVDIRHLLNIAKSITITGKPLPNTYHGIKNRNSDNVSLLLGTESVIKSLQLGIKKAKSHKISGITDSCLYSTVLPLGTNYNKVIMNLDFIKTHTKSTEELVNELLG